MTLLAVLLSIVILSSLGAAACAVALLVLLRRSSAPPRIGHRVTVHTKKPDDQTIFGVLVGDYADRIVLEDAEYVTAAGGKPIPGQQHIATSSIAWIDVFALVATESFKKAPEAVALERKLGLVEPIRDTGQQGG